MLKKAGIIAAVAAVGVIGLTPFAFATTDAPAVEKSNVQETTVDRDNQSADCDAAQNAPVTGAGGLGVVVGVPVNANVPIASCNNVDVKDLVDSGTTNPDTELTGNDN